VCKGVVYWLLNVSVAASRPGGKKRFVGRQTHL